MYDELMRIKRETVICPRCGGPLFPILDGQPTPDVLVKYGIERKDTKICYICQLAWFLKEEPKPVTA